jgi:hypothetical protein
MMCSPEWIIDKWLTQTYKPSIAMKTLLSALLVAFVFGCFVSSAQAGQLSHGIKHHHHHHHHHKV